MRLPDFLIIGAMKAGTSSLAKYLGAHPNVFMATEKEIHFFDLHYKRGLDWYATRFASARAEQQLGEATPIYMYDREAFGRLAAALPEVRLIVILRNPIDRAYSHYWRAVEHRGEETLSFEAALSAESERVAHLTGFPAAQLAYAARGRYAEQLEMVFRRFPRERVLVLRFENLINQSEETFRLACHHIGVSESFVPEGLGRVHLPGNGVRSLTLHRLFRMIPGRLRVPFRLLNRTKGYPPMNPDTRARLVEEFRPWNARLGALLGEDFSDWDK